MVADATSIYFINSVDFSHRANSKSVDISTISNTAWEQENELWASNAYSVDQSNHMAGMIENSNEMMNNVLKVIEIIIETGED